MRRANGRAAALVCGAAMALGGCAATETLTSSVKGVGSSLGNLVSFGSSTSAPGPAASAGGVPERQLQCPTVEVLDGTASYRTYAGTDQTNENVRYQFSMGDVARDCTHSGKDVLLKVGVEGRVLLGPAGSPGSFTVPVRIAVRRDSDGKVAAAKFYQVPATVAAGQDSTEFQVVSDPIAVPFVTSNSDDDYTILVGFDASGKPAPGAEAEKKKPRRGGHTRPVAAD